MIYGRLYKGFQKNPITHHWNLGGVNFVSSQSGDVPGEDLVNFGYKLNMNVIFLKT
jgi:hypothetical protein